MKILMLAKSSLNPATRYRVDPIVRKLKDRGDQVHCVFDPGLKEQWLLVLTAHRFDVVFIQRKLFQPRYMALLRRVARKIVFDHDDAIFLRANGSTSRTRQRRYDAMLKAADLVLAGNHYLAAKASESGKRIEVVPTCVELDRYQTVVDKMQAVTLVWIGSQSTSRYLEKNRLNLEAIGRAFPEIQLKIISDSTLQLANLKTINVAWSLDSEVTELGSCHIGIAPMVDDDWTRGKCALKVIQYMAAGLPVISSAVGANAEIIVDGVTGLLVNDEQQWVGAVRILMDQKRRQDMGEAGRIVATEHYSIDKTATRVIELIDQLATSS